MRILPILLLAVLAVSDGGHADENRRLKSHNLNPDGVALQGYDPVSYHLGPPQKGKSEWNATRNGIRYHFASINNRDRFQSNPTLYEPAYGGWCAWAMLEGDKVDIDPESFKIIDGRNYLFYNGFWGDTLKKWNARAAKEAEPVLVQKADANWARAKN